MKPSRGGRRAMPWPFVAGLLSTCSAVLDHRIPSNPIEHRPIVLVLTFVMGEHGTRVREREALPREARVVCIGAQELLVDEDVRDPESAQQLERATLITGRRRSSGASGRGEHPDPRFRRVEVIPTTPRENAR